VIARRFALAALLAASSLAAAPDEPYDLVLTNGRIVDGTGNPWYRADVAVRGDTIVRIAPSIREPARRVVDVGGRVIAPGFIDIHSHGRRGLFEDPAAENYLRQGVTTMIEGPDGSSPVPLAPFLADLELLSKSVNVGTFIGQGSVREEVLGEEDRAPTAAELDAMRALVAQGMADGAFGLSSGLFYVPGAFSPTAEVVDLARVAACGGGIYISHMRDEAGRILESVRETIAIGEQAGLPTQVTHHKVIGAKNWGRSVDTLRLIDEARARGVDATIDQYPYTASSTSVGAALMPAWAQEGGEEKVLARLRDPEERRKILAETQRLIREERGGGDPKRVVLAECEWDATLDGRNLAQAAASRGLPPTVEGAAEAALWIVEKGDCSGIFHAIGEEDLDRILRHPATMVASDGGIPIPGEGVPHPRSYGTFARVLAVFVRERRVLTLEEAVRKMSGFPAQRLGLEDRGILRPGLKADLAVFDSERVRDVATFEKPHRYSEGFSLVVVNGVVVLDEKGVTAARPGRVLYGPAWQGRRGAP
jgi:dihydroorotase/N-acyl-D-amino-acid deacylase